MTANGCKKPDCTDKNIQTTKLNIAEFYEQPYKGKDALLLMNESGDTVTFNGSDTMTYYNSEESGTSCSGIDNKYQGIQIIFSDKSGRKLFFNQYMPYGSKSETAHTDISVFLDNINFVFNYASLSGSNLNQFILNGKVYPEVRTVVINQDSLYYSLHSGIIRISLHSTGRLLQLK
jgi:hypothetical protein